MHTPDRVVVGAARSHSNIAFIKYWGNRDEALRLPANGSISMNLAGLDSEVSVSFDPDLGHDLLTLNGNPQTGQPLDRVTRHLDHIRRLAGVTTRAIVTSSNNFPTGTGIASSASAFAALTVAACAALHVTMTETELSVLARLGSGSASRSIPGGFVEWYMGNDHQSSFAQSIAPATHWELRDIIAVLSTEHKPVGSTEGHRIANTSPLQNARVADAARRLEVCRKAILGRDFDALAEIIELDALMMHAVMMTSRPCLIYWHPETLAIIGAVRQWRSEGLACAFTIDAGPNVHVICESKHSEAVGRRLRAFPDVKTVYCAPPGGPTEVIPASFC